MSCFECVGNALLEQSFCRKYRVFFRVMLTLLKRENALNYADNRYFYFARTKAGLVLLFSVFAVFVLCFNNLMNIFVLLLKSTKVLRIKKSHEQKFIATVETLRGHTVAEKF